MKPTKVFLGVQKSVAEKKQNAEVTAKSLAETLNVCQAIDIRDEGYVDVKICTKAKAKRRNDGILQDTSTRDRCGTAKVAAKAQVEEVSKAAPGWGRRLHGR